jgi:hypothetical protein
VFFFGYDLYGIKLLVHVQGALASSIGEGVVKKGAKNGVDCRSQIV